LFHDEWRQRLHVPHQIIVKDQRPPPPFDGAQLARVDCLVDTRMADVRALARFGDTEN
jgi:hypothetical protein